MRKVFLFLASALLLPLVVKGQGGGISGAGSLGCNAPTITGTAWNSGTANNTTQALFTGFSGAAILVQLDQTTTITGGAVTFNISFDGGVNYQSVAVANLLNPATGAQLTNPYTLVASTNQPFLVIMAGATNLQLKLTTAITGSASVTPYTTPLCLLPANIGISSGIAGGDLSGFYPNPTVVQVNGAVVPTSATALASNSSKQLVAATVQGNGAKVQLSTGTTTTNDCVKFDANGNTVDAGAACGSGGGGNTISGTSLTQYSVYYQGVSALALAEANASTTLPAICVAATTSTCQFSGTLTNGSWTWTVGGVLYVSDSSAGTMTQTAPTTSGHFVQVVGVALSATQILIMPSLNVAGIL